ncbi:hypothetical protein [Actinacidiphila oryziradicis]|uniref:Uncharacterized protein n=1 Tax=Actinacidiphila oryziradicis TaxID=2571141 RepID=A0A4U0T5V0_9ACTN|nr:hypothetical protein [Actinacidiphila oryziradicis]TKA08105.1 hypothetical protein FCI23_29895 [Actinacidiphila oryziradicis]
MTEPWPGSRPWTPSEVRGRRRRTLSGYQRGIGEQDGRGRAPDWVFNVAVCLNRPSDATLRQVESVLGAISFGGSTG